MNDTLRFTVCLPAHPISVGVARAVIRSLATFLPSQSAESAVLILSELVTNSIRHGSGGPDDPVEVELVLEDRLLSGSVSDRGPAFELPVGRPDPEHAGGFGLHIARSLSQLTIEHTDRGNRVAFTLPMTH